MPSLVEHLDGLGLIALTIGEELIELRARLFLICGGAGAIEALRTRLGRDDRGQVSELLRLQRDELVAGL